VEPDGSLLVSERLAYDFGPTRDRHGIFRDLVLSQPCNEGWDRVFPLSDVEVASPTGAPATVVVEEAGTGSRLRIGDADRNVSGIQQYTIDYRIEGLTNAFPDRDELYWNAIGTGWGVPIFDARVVVTSPAPPTQATCFTGPVRSVEPCAAMVVAGDTVTYTQPYLAPGEALTIALALPPGTIDAPRLLEQRWSLARAFSVTPFTVVGAGLLAVVVVAAVGFAGFRIGRDRQAVGSPTDIAFAPAGTEGVPVPLVGGDHGSPVEVVPPDGIRPAQMALILDEKVSARDVTATIVDLAVRGTLRIEEVDDGDDFRLVRLRHEDPRWTGYERTLVGELFGSGDEVLLSSLAQKFAAQLKQVTGEIYADAMERRWFAARPDHVRLGVGVVGFLLTAAAVGVVVLLAAFTELALLGVPLVVGGLAVLLFSGRFPRRTPVGTGLYRRSRGFQRFIDDSEAPRARFAEQQNIFSEYLPYAIVLGSADRWAKTFAPLGAAAVTAGTVGATGALWYVGAGPFLPGRLTDATERFAASASTTLQSTPPSSSGSSGFSGGGFSGGGGGGGGGGSW
jgi:hypothetical protein